MKKNFYEEPKKHKKISTNCSLFATKKKGTRGITLIALVITIVLNCSYLATERMLKKEKILKKEETSSII